MTIESIVAENILIINIDNPMDRLQITYRIT